MLQKVTTRLETIVDILATNDCKSQRALGELLAERGITVSQATLSRDLGSLPAVKVKGVYVVLPELPSQPKED